MDLFTVVSAHASQIRTKIKVISSWKDSNRIKLLALSIGSKVGRRFLTSKTKSHVNEKTSKHFGVTA